MQIQLEEAENCSPALVENRRFLIKIGGKPSRNRSGDAAAVSGLQNRTGQDARTSRHRTGSR